MTSADSNLFVYAADPNSPRYAASRNFFESTRNLPSGFALCELVLVQVYMLLRNPALFAKPYSAKQAVDYCQALRRHPTWEPITLTKACTPRTPPSTVRWILDAHDGTVIDLEPEAAPAWMPTAPRYKRERAEPASNPTHPHPSSLIPHPSDDGLVLEIEDPDPWAQDSEPIFWTD